MPSGHKSRVAIVSFTSKLHASNTAHSKLIRLFTLSVLGVSLLLQTACAQTFRERMQQRQEARSASAADDEVPDNINLPASIKVTRNIAYGADARQKYDVYRPQLSSTKQAAREVIFMVHGGGWYVGDKSARSVVENKARYWVERGYVFVSANYRMVPQADPLQQAHDVARALAHAQAQAAQWGADAEHFILMGHSAGAHLVALLASSPTIAQAEGAKPWLGTVSLDSGAMDVPAIMQHRHLPLYDRAFGNDPGLWRAVSPIDQLTIAGAPVLAVCSTQRDDSCRANHAFAARARSVGMEVQVLPEDQSHREINEQLGVPSDYTAAVDRFIESLR